jgi:hypothetical protein
MMDLFGGSPDPRVWASKRDLDVAFASLRAIEAKLDDLAKRVEALEKAEKEG